MDRAGAARMMVQRGRRTGHRRWVGLVRRCGGEVLEHRPRRAPGCFGGKRSPALLPVSSYDYLRATGTPHWEAWRADALWNRRPYDAELVHLGGVAFTASTSPPNGEPPTSAIRAIYRPSNRRHLHLTEARPSRWDR